MSHIEHLYQCQATSSVERRVAKTKSHDLRLCSLAESPGRAALPPCLPRSPCQTCIFVAPVKRLFLRRSPCIANNVLVRGRITAVKLPGPGDDDREATLRQGTMHEASSNAIWALDTDGLDVCCSFLRVRARPRLAGPSRSAPGMVFWTLGVDSLRRNLKQGASGARLKPPALPAWHRHARSPSAAWDRLWVRPRRASIASPGAGCLE